MKRINSDKGYTTHLQPVFIIGTYNEDGSPNFCPITWVTSSHDGPQGLMVISMNGPKKTKKNIARTGVLSANLVSIDMLEMLDYFGSHTGLDAPKNALPYEYEDGYVLNVPTLNISRRVFECQVVNTFETSDTITYFCKSMNRQEIEGLCGKKEDTDLLEPLVYTGRYHKLGEYLGEMETFYKTKETGTMTNTELVKIVEKFAECGWDAIDAPAKKWLAANASADTTLELIKAVQQADKDCGSCGCEFDPLYKKALELLHADSN